MKYLLCLFGLVASIGFVYAEDKTVPPVVVAPVEKTEALVFPATLEKAAKENKSAVLLFTGKAWCGPCQELEKTIILTEAFTAFAKKSIVFAVFDYPQSESPSAENQKLAEEYGIEGFPTILVTDEKGLPYQRIQFTGQTKEVFIAEIETTIKRRGLKIKFLASKDEAEKKKISDEFMASRSEGENFIFFADLIAYSVLQNKELKAEEKIKQLNDLYINSSDASFLEKLGADIKKIDPEKKFGSARLFAIKEFISFMIAHDDTKAFEFFSANKAQFKGDDLGYIYQLAMHLKEEGKKEKTIEILNYILTDEDIKKNEEAVKGITEQLKELKAEPKKAKVEKVSLEGDPSVNIKVESVKKPEETKPVEKVEEKPVKKEEVKEAK